MPSTAFKNHIAATDAAKVAARQKAKDLLAQITAKDWMTETPEELATGLMDGVVTSIQDELDAAGASASAYADSVGYDALDAAAIDGLKADGVQSVYDDALASILDVVTAAETKLNAMTDTQALFALDNQASSDALFSGLPGILSLAAGNMVQGFATDVVSTATENYTADNPDELLEWQCEDGESCDDAFENSCGPRDGEQLTSDEWSAVGEPGSGNLLCESYGRSCRCSLEPTGEMAQAASNG
jgi:hypothetical protein